MKHIICAGHKYTDIDVLASSLALKNLMNLRGERASVHLTGPFNATIPKDCKYWDTKDVIKTVPAKGENTHFIIVDISNPQHFEHFVDVEKVSSVYDHHYGYEEFWHNLIQEKAKIEPVGACATLIWEEFQAHYLSHRISSSSANLLYTAIISNTLNFKAQVSSVRESSRNGTLSLYLPSNELDSTIL